MAADGTKASGRRRAPSASIAPEDPAGDGFSARDEQALEEVLRVLTAARDGDFSVRLRARRRDVIGDVQQRCNELIELNARQAKELARVSRVIGREGRMTERVSLGTVDGAWSETVESVNAHDRRPRPPDDRDLAASSRRWRSGDLSQKMALTIEGQPVKGEFSAIGHDGERDGRPARLVRRRGHARRARGRHGRQARRPGAGQGRQRHVARPDGERQLDGVEPDRPGAPDRAGHDRGRQRRPDARRSPSTHAARSSSSRTRSTRWSTSCRRSPPRSRASRARSARRASSAARREVKGVSGTWRDLTENVNFMASNLTDQVRQIAAGDDRGRPRRPHAEGHGRGQGRGRDARRDDQLDDRHAARVRRAGDRRRARGRHRRRARRPGGGLRRRRHVEAT